MTNKILLLHIDLYYKSTDSVAKPVISTANSITGRSITCIEKSDLKEMGISMGKRLEIFQKLKELGDGQASSTPKGKYCAKKIKKVIQTHHE